MKVAKLNGKLLTNIKSKTILGGNTQEKTVTPSTERQVITADSGYTCLDKVNVEAVTSAIDSNIIPENIKKDVEILGVTGTMESASVPTKSWLYITEWDSNGYLIKAKTIGCSGDMPYEFMYSDNNPNQKNVLETLQEFEINEGVTSIASFAFRYCNSLTSITIPNSVTSIGNNAFNGCTSLPDITIGNSVTSIGYEAFYNCTSLSSIVMPSALTSIENYAFHNCTKLLLFDFRKVTQVPKLENVRVFYYTSSKKKIVVPDSLYDEWITATNWSSSTNNIVSSIIKASDYEASL